VALWAVPAGIVGGRLYFNQDRDIRAPGLFALYDAGYSAFRIFEESLRIDYSQHILGLRLNVFVASILGVGGITWFIVLQWRRPRVRGGDGQELVSAPLGRG
jgi:prolipoprotein diacylglyceryltransferase